MASVEAMWTLHFDAEGGEKFELGGGVLVFETGRLFGGDSGYAYLGSFSLSGDDITGTVRILRHDRNITSIFGDVDEINGTFNARRVSEARIEGVLNVPGGPPVMLQMTRLAELP